MNKKQNYEQSNLYRLRHTTEHVFNQAIEELFPGKITRAMGPPVEDGWYNDSRWDIEISEEMFGKIEKRMQKIINENFPLIEKEVSEKEAREMFKDNPFKQEFIDEFIKEGGKLTVYYTGDPDAESGSYKRKVAGESAKRLPGDAVFVDLCKGPHVEKTREIQAFKLLSIAGAYWRGDEKNEMLTRVYGTAFESQEEMGKYIKMIEEAKKRDHKKIAKDMDLYFIDEMVGKGLIMWLPRGNKIKDIIEDYAKEVEEKGEYQRVTTPVIAKKELFLTSGHLPYYEDDMYPAMKMDDGEYYLKAMNCPHHHRIFLHNQHSYKDLPLRIAEYGRCHRNEQSGELSGLLRVRGMEMNDAHIYLRKDQIKSEFKAVISMIQKYFDTFGFKKYWFRLSKWDPKRTDKYIDEPENWKFSEQMIREVLQEIDCEFIEAEDEAAFYGPKVDVQFESVYGREESMSTVQLDFIAKERFGLSFIDEDGNENGDVFVIHRAPLSVHERFLAFLIEHYAGAFPVWLHPEQVAIVPVSEKFNDYAESIKKQIQKNLPDARVIIKDENERMQKRIREAQVQKIPYMLIVGGQEKENGSVNVRLRNEEQVGEISIEEFIKRLEERIETKSLEL